MIVTVDGIETRDPDVLEQPAVLCVQSPSYHIWTRQCCLSSIHWQVLVYT